MNQVVLALAMLATASARAPAVLSEDYTFAQYMVDFKRSYSKREMLAREKAFEAAKARMIAHNKSGKTWTENVNELTDALPAEVDAKKGIHRGLLHKTRAAHQSKPTKADPASWPAEKDWRQEGVVTSVKDQGHCGSCWTFAAAECLESNVAIQTGTLFTLSEQEFVSCVENPLECGGTGGCMGATMEAAYEYAMASGLVTEWTTPYTSYNGVDGNCTLGDPDLPVRVAGITGYEVTAMNDYASLMDAVANVGPVGITVDASKWSGYAGGVFDGCDQASPELDHGVLLVGYGTDESLGDYWLVRNSWGPVWGENGYIRLARTSDESNRCGTDVNPADGTGCKDGPPTVEVCGTCGILYDASYPTGAFLM